MKPRKEEIQRECELEKDTAWSQGLMQPPPSALAPKWEGKKVLLPVGEWEGTIRGVTATLKLEKDTMPSGATMPTWSSQDSEEIAEGLGYLSGPSHKSRASSRTTGIRHVLLEGELTWVWEDLGKGRK